MRLLLSVGLFLMLCVEAASSQQPDFDYLKIKGHTVESTHRIRYRLRVDKSFKLLGEYHHRPTFDSKVFNVSVTAFADRDTLVMIHAEAHRDGSGGLDYSNLKADPLGDINFTSREQCAVLAEIPDIEAIPDLRFLRDKGFSASPALYLKQYLIASPDGTSEYVLSYGKRVASCASETLTPAFKAQVDGELRTRLRIVKY
jgi:hypothetical protein